MKLKFKYRLPWVFLDLRQINPPRVLFLNVTWVSQWVEVLSGNESQLFGTSSIGVWTCMDYTNYTVVQRVSLLGVPDLISCEIT